jgi:hypothetical protein
MKTKLVAALFILPLLFIGSCKKDDLTELKSGSVNVRMKNTAYPCAYEEVNVDVRCIEVHIGGSTGGDWYKLHTNAGIYNVLALCNGIDTLVANDAAVPAGEITAVRLNLGSNNSIRKSGNLYPIAILPGDEARLQFEIYETIGSAPMHLQLGFSAGESVIQDGQEAFHLAPVLHVYKDSLR